MTKIKKSKKRTKTINRSWTSQANENIQVRILDIQIVEERIKYLRDVLTDLKRELRFAKEMMKSNNPQWVAENLNRMKETND